MRIDPSRFLAILTLNVLVACQAGNQLPVERLPASASSTSPPPATETTVPIPTAPRVPPPLPGVYQSPGLHALDTPHTYVGDNCEYLRDKWDPEAAAPGTVVMIVMLQAINQGNAESWDAIGVAAFRRMMDELHRQKFQAINTLQLVDFLDHNARIPFRSVVLIQDGRRLTGNFDENFRPFWELWRWPVVNAWDSQPNTTEALWADSVLMENEGFVDHQVYGPILDPKSDKVTDQYLTDQLQAPVEAFREHFDKSPIAVIWPNGFGARSAQIARTLGYRLGFTFNARGPIMFNWVPLAESADNSRPAYLPEGSVHDPLMTLPRYLPSQVHGAIDSVRVLGKQAAAYAEQNKAAEMEYYDIVCAARLGAIPQQPAQMQ